jgi:hypothetical protein
MLQHEPIHEVLRINHYWTKSVEEFHAKRTRGCAYSGPGFDCQRLIKDIESDLAAVNDTVTNDTTINWAIPLVKARLQARFSARP